uniref:Uncharacterized protein n=1 Tax=Glossina austeni TaxID=7395 RepID=A0A1A9UVQ4_GLOAU
MYNTYTYRSNGKGKLKFISINTASLMISEEKLGKPSSDAKVDEKISYCREFIFLNTMPKQHRRISRKLFYKCNPKKRYNSDFIWNCNFTCAGVKALIGEIVAIFESDMKNIFRNT